MASRALTYALLVFRAQGNKDGPCGPFSNQTYWGAGGVTEFAPASWQTIEIEESFRHIGAPWRLALLDETLTLRAVLLDHIPHDDAAPEPDFDNETTFTKYRITVYIPDVDCKQCSLQMLSVMVDTNLECNVTQCTYFADDTDCSPATCGGGDPVCKRPNTCFANYHSCAGASSVVTLCSLFSHFRATSQSYFLPYCFSPPPRRAHHWHSRSIVACAQPAARRLAVPEIHHGIVPRRVVRVVSGTGAHALLCPGFLCRGGRVRGSATNSSAAVRTVGRVGHNDHRFSIGRWCGCTRGARRRRVVVQSTTCRRRRRQRVERVAARQWCSKRSRFALHESRPRRLIYYFDYTPKPCGIQYCMHLCLSHLATS